LTRPPNRAVSASASAIAAVTICTVIGLAFAPGSASMAAFRAAARKARALSSRPAAISGLAGLPGPVRVTRPLR
jgi:hypothetical protein